MFTKLHRYLGPVGLPCALALGMACGPNPSTAPSPATPDPITVKPARPPARQVTAAKAAAEWSGKLPVSSILRDAAFDREGDLFLAPTMMLDGEVSGHTLPKGLSLVTIKADGALRWQKHISTSRETFVRSIALRDDGDFIIAGTFSGSLAFDELQVQSEGDRDAFVALISKDGTGKWLRSLGGLAREEATSTAISDDGERISIGGWAESSFRFAGNSYPARGTAKDGFVATFDASGTPLWAARYQGVGIDEVHSMAYEHRSLVVLGSFSTAMRVPGYASNTRGERDIFMVRYGPKGSVDWMQSFGSDKADYGVALQKHSTGNLRVIALSQGDMQLGAMPLPALGKSDLVLWTLDGDGQVQAAKRYGGDGKFVALDAEGHETMTLSGYYQGAGRLSHLQLPASDKGRAFVLTIDESLALLSAEALDSPRLLFTRQRFGRSLQVNLERGQAELSLGAAVSPN